MRPPQIRCQTLLLVSFLAALGACGGGGGSGSDAVDAFEDSISALEEGKLSAYVQASLPKVRLDEMKAEWDAKRKTPLMSPDEATQFRETMAMLTAKDAEDQLFGKLAPQLATIEEGAGGLAQMLPMLAGMGGEQAAPAIDTLSALAERLPDLGLDDQQKLKQAIAVATGTARKLDVKDADALAKLGFSELLAKADVIYAGAIDLLEVYGLSIEKSLESTEVTVQSAAEDKAVLAVSYSLFDGPRRSRNIEMAHVDGRWVPTGR